MSSPSIFHTEFGGKIRLPSNQKNLLKIISYNENNWEFLKKGKRSIGLYDELGLINHEYDEIILCPISYFTVSELIGDDMMPLSSEEQSKLESEIIKSFHDDDIIFI